MSYNNNRRCNDRRFDKHRPECRVFVRKTGGFDVYKWAPTANNLGQGKDSDNRVAKPYFCTATAGSQGQDWISTYGYNVVWVNGQEQHLAYVECDYVA